MPDKGWKSITIREEVFQELLELWKSNMNNYRKQGITSFSGFITKILYENLEAIEGKEKLIVNT